MRQSAFPSLCSALGAMLLCMAPPLHAQSPVQVQVAAVTRGGVGEVLRLSGTLRALQDAELSPRIDGLIATLEVDAGAQVQAGEVLLRLDDTLAELALDAATAALEAARAAREEAARRVAEAEPLVQQRSLPQTELAARRAVLQQASAEQRAAEALLRSRREERDRHVLRAPFAGVVAERRVDIGEWVTRSTPVVQLVAQAPVVLEVQAPQERFDDLHAEVPVWIEPDRTPGVALPARVVARVPVTAGGGARSFLLRIASADTQHPLLPGSSARARFELGETQGVRIPRDALLRHPDGGYSVYVAVDAGQGLVARRRPVQLGRSADAWVSVLEGLTVGESVVVRGNEALSEGQTLRVAESAAAASNGAPRP